MAWSDIRPDEIRRSPHDFIRGIDVDGDKALWLAHLTRSLPPDDDARVSVEDGSGAVAVFAERLPWDSDFFGFGVGRIAAVVTQGTPDESLVEKALGRALQELRALGVTYVSTSVDSRETSLIRTLTSSGLRPIEARLTYHLDAAGWSPEERYPVRFAAPADIEPLGRAAADTVNPFDRFHADPYLEPHAAALMREWVRASIESGFADQTVVPDVPEPAAFLTLKYHKDKWEAWRMKIAQPVFSAVAPEFRGWYRKLVVEGTRHLVDIGAEHLFLTTQATNNAVIATWERLGYRYGRCELVMSLILR